MCGNIYETSLFFYGEFSLLVKSSSPQANLAEKTDAKASVFSGGGRWIRTTEVTDNRFTVCPLWPLGNSPIMELVNGVEPSTC